MTPHDEKPLPQLDSTNCCGLPCNSADDASHVYCYECVALLCARLEAAENIREMLEADGARLEAERDALAEKVEELEEQIAQERHTAEALRARLEAAEKERDEWRSAASDDMECICGCAEDDHETYDDGFSCDNDDHWCLFAPISVGVELREVTAKLARAESALRDLIEVAVTLSDWEEDELRVLAVARAYFAAGDESKQKKERPACHTEKRHADGTCTCTLKRPPVVQPDAAKGPLFNGVCLSCWGAGQISYKPCGCCPQTHMRDCYSCKGTGRAEPSK